MKKGDISINVIIIAVISLMVLVVLLMIFSGRMGNFVEGVDDTENQMCSDFEGYRYVLFNSRCPQDYVATISSYQDVPNGYKCCIPDQSVN